MRWNWQQKDWPHFRWEKQKLEAMEAQFLHQAGIFLGVAKHLSEENKKLLIVDIMTDEAVKTSEIEGEYLNRDSVQSSLRRHFDLDSDTCRIPPGVSLSYWKHEG